jgi:hypothetical protein
MEQAGLDSGENNESGKKKTSRGERRERTFPEVDTQAGEDGVMVREAGLEPALSES